MATVNVYSAERMAQIEEKTIITAEVVDGHLILTRLDSTELDSGLIVPDIDTSDLIGQFATIDRPDATISIDKILWDTDEGMFFKSDGVNWVEVVMGGVPGPPGADGVDGVDGVDGTNGADGIPGTDAVLLPASVGDLEADPTRPFDRDKLLLPDDGAAIVPSLRTLGTGALQAASGDDPRFATVGDQPGNNYSMRPKVVGKWYMPPCGRVFIATTVVPETATVPGNTMIQLAAGVGHWVPIRLPAGTIDRLYTMIRIAATNATLLHMALYADVDWVASGDPLAQGTIDANVRTDNAASGIAQSITVNYVHSGGLLWVLVLWPSGSAGTGPIILGQTCGMPIAIHGDGANTDRPTASSNVLSSHFATQTIGHATPPNAAETLIPRTPYGGPFAPYPAVAVRYSA